MTFELIKKVPIVQEQGVSWFYDTGCPHAEIGLCAGVQNFHGIPGLRMRGIPALKRFTKFDYVNREIITSDEPILLEGAESVPLEVRSTGWLVQMTVGGVQGMRYIDTGSAFSYVHNLGKGHPFVETVEDCSFNGRPWTAPVYRVPCTFAGHPFEILCADALDNHAATRPGEAVPEEGVIGYDFFRNFVVVVDQRDGVLQFRGV